MNLEGLLRSKSIRGRILLPRPALRAYASPDRLRRGVGDVLSLHHRALLTGATTERTDDFNPWRPPIGFHSRYSLVFDNVRAFAARMSFKSAHASVSLPSRSKLLARSSAAEAPPLVEGIWASGAVGAAFGTSLDGPALNHSSLGRDESHPENGRDPCRRRGLVARLRWSSRSASRVTGVDEDVS